MQARKRRDVALFPPSKIAMFLQPSSAGRRRRMRRVPPPAREECTSEQSSALEILTTLAPVARRYNGLQFTSGREAAVWCDWVRRLLDFGSGPMLIDRDSAPKGRRRLRPDTPASTAGFRNRDPTSPNARES